MDDSLVKQMGHCRALKHAILHDEPLDTQLDIIAKSTPHTAATESSSSSSSSTGRTTEWEFYLALTLMRSDPTDKRIDKARETLRTASGGQSFLFIIHQRTN